MLRLGDLGKLLRVPHEHEAGRRKADGCRCGEGELARLVDEHEIEGLAMLLAREEPGGAADEPVFVGHLGVVVDDLDEALPALVLGTLRTLVDALERPSLGRRASLDLVLSRRS